jgi:CBS-domain-containing membrane protein
MTEKQENPQLVRDLMTVGVETCTPDTPVPDLARLMFERGLEAVVVMEEGNAEGVVNQSDIVRAYSRLDARKLTAENIMQPGVPQVPPDIPLTAAAQVMLDEGVRALFLMHASGGIEYAAGVLTFRHLLRHLAARDTDELKDLGIQAERQTPLDLFIQKRDAARRMRK